MKKVCILTVAATVNAREGNIEDDLNNLRDSFIDLIGSAGKSLEKALNTAAEENQPKVDDFVDKVNDLSVSMKPKIDEAIDRIQDHVEEARDKFLDLADKASDYLEDLAIEIDTQDNFLE